MKYCLRNRQTNEYLQKADEIKAEYRDYKSFPDLIEKYPDKTIICQIYFHQENIDWAALKNASVLAKGNFICCVGTWAQIQECKANGLKFYYGFPIQTFEELRALKHHGACYVRLGAPLFFQMDKVAAVGIPVRAVPNVAHLSDIPRENGVCGTWIRPEDLDIYEKYITAIEFEDCDQKKEQALFRIYAEGQGWPGPLDTLFTNFNYEGSGRFIHRSAMECRPNCGQRCMETGTCQLCYRELRLANAEVVAKFMPPTD